MVSSLHCALVCLLSCSMAFYLEEVMNCTRSLLLVVSGWVPRHVIGAVLVSLPAISVLSHLTSVHLPLQVKIWERFHFNAAVRVTKHRDSD